MITHIDKLTEHGCAVEKKDRVCRSRGGESCAFDGAMIVLQPIADAAHLIHGPIACCGNSWEGRGSLSSRGVLHKMGFTTDMSELDVVYGAEDKLKRAIEETASSVMPKAIFVYATCVSGLIGEDIDLVCKDAQRKLGIPVIPVNAPGFVGPKNLGNRIAGEVLLDHVIGTGEPPFLTDYDINLIGEYNIAGDLRLVEPVLKAAGINILSRITGDATFNEITYAHRAKLNVVVCSRALINVAREMEKRYGIPFVEVSFFGKTEMSKAIRMIVGAYRDTPAYQSLADKAESVIEGEEGRLDGRLKSFEHLKGKKAVLYTGGVKSWSFISALMDLGIEIKAVGTKKSSVEDEEKMKRILGEDAPLIEDTTPGNLLRLLRENEADLLVAGGRNQYLGIKEGYPFIDVNQERHTAYAGYDGLLNLAKQISDAMRFYGRQRAAAGWPGIAKKVRDEGHKANTDSCLIDPLKHSQSIGAAMAFQGVHNALPIIHGAQGCTFLGKVLLTKHFREPIALAGTKLFAEDVIMGSDEKLSKTIDGVISKNSPEVIAVLSSGLSEVRGDDVSEIVKKFRQTSEARVLHVPTPDYEGGLETGYARAVEEMVRLAFELCPSHSASKANGRINVLVGSHLTPADFTELREIIGSFGLRPIMLPDLSALDGSRVGISPIAKGGTSKEEIALLASSEFTIAIGASMEGPAKLIKEKFNIEYRVFESLTGLRDTDVFMKTISLLGGKPMAPKYERQRRVLADGMRDAHFYFGGKRIGIALEPDLALQTSAWLDEMGAKIKIVVLPQSSKAADKIPAEDVVIGGLSGIKGGLDVLISNSHAEDAAGRLGVPLYQTGFPVYKVIGNTAKVTIGYGGTHAVINEVANLLIRGGHS